jgi:antitoxin component YwqK of YwqJK toxin-antitoxin module
MKNFSIIIFSIFILTSCKNQDINDKSKRNANWVWWVDAKTQKGKWIPVGDQTTVTDGEYTEFYSNGSIYEHGKLIDGINADTTFNYDQQGMLAVYSFTKTGTTDTCNYFMRDGYYKAYDQQGLILEEGVVKNHQADNPWITYYENGRKEFECKDGVDSVWTSINYYENGRVKDSGFEINNQRKFFICKGWYPSGQLRIQMGWKGKNADGLKTLYYEMPGQLESTIKEQANFKNGIQNGIAVKYYKSGQIEISTNFVNGKANGNKKEWYENGRLKASATFENDIQTGLELQYYDNSQIKDSVTKKNDEFIGTEKKWYKNGQLELLAIYENGNIISQKKYDESGNIITASTF